MPPVAQQLVGTPRMMLPPMGLRDRRIDECPTMWFNRDFFEFPWPDWQVDAIGPTRFVSHTNPGETLLGHRVRITLTNPRIVWMSTNRFCRMGGPFGEVLIEARWPD